MGDSATLEKARTELEELYLGIPDDSVNLSFHDLADVIQNTKPSEKRKPTTLMEPIHEAKPTKGATPLNKLPSLDFTKGLQACRQHNFDHVKSDSSTTGDMYGRHAFHNYLGEESHATPGHRHHASTNGHSGFGHVADVDGRSMNAHDDVSSLGMASMYQERGRGRRRLGIPHSNICTNCSTYIYIFRHRCLVCGRVYCRQCVGMGMGEMTEGRKCIECLGRRFSQRYIERAGKTGCCFGYPSLVKQAELKWAEKGPRRSGERAYGHGQGRSVMMSSRPMTPRAHADSSPPSFVMSTSFSPYTPTHHHLPLPL